METRQAAVRIDAGAATWLVAIAVVVVSLALLLCLPPTAFQAWDFVQLHAIYRQYARDVLRSGALPLWNPYANLGRPFLADMETANWYPPNLLFVLLPAGAALAAVLALHLALVLLGTRALGRYLGMSPAASALAALGFAAGNIVTSRLLVGQLHFVEGLAYLPLLLLLTARLQDGFNGRRLALLATALALQLLSGHPQIAWVTWFGLAAFQVGRQLPARPLVLMRRVARDAAAWGGALLLALALAAVQLLPFAEMVRHGNRAAASLQFAAIGQLPPRDASSLLLPPGPGHFVSWEYNLYGGSLIALAGAAGLFLLRDRNIRGLALGATLAGLLAVGDRTPAFALAYWLIPGVSAFRIHCRLAIWTCFALCMAAGLFLSRPVSAPRPGRATLATVVAFALALCLGARCTVEAWPLRLLLTVVPGVVLWAVWSRTGTRASTVAVAVALGADLLSAGLDLKRIYWAWPSYGGEAVVAERLRGAGLLREGLPPPRTSLPRSYARPNSGMLYGFSTYSGYAGLSPARAFAYLHRRLDLPLPVDAGTFPSAAVAARDAFPFDSMNLVLGLDPRTGALRWRPAPDPRAILVFRTLTVSHWTEALERVRGGHDEARVALVEDPELALPEGEREDGSTAGGTAEVVQFAAEAVRVRVDGPRPAVLVLKEAWYPGWTARIDGHPAPCHPANVWARAVRVPAGRHEVEFVYRQRWLRTGAVVSALCALLLLVLFRGTSRA